MGLRSFWGLRVVIMSFKQVIVVRQDLNLPKGKLASQVAHASVEGVLHSKRDVLQVWREHGMKKVVLKVKGEKELLELRKKALAMKLVAKLIHDAGRTVVAPNMLTCLGIGPDEEKKIDKLTGKLKMV